MAEKLRILLLEDTANAVAVIERQLQKAGIGFGCEQSKTRTALRENEARYRPISENSGDVIWILTIAAQRFTYVSPAVFSILGLTPAEVLAGPLAAVLTPESYQVLIKDLFGRIAALAAGEQSARVWTNEIDQVRKDGSIVSTEVVTTLLTNAAGQVLEILGVTRDVGQRIRRRNIRAPIFSNNEKLEKPS